MVCPNKNLPEWKELVDSFGEDIAMEIFSITDEIPSLEQISILKSNGYEDLKEDDRLSVASAILSTNPIHKELLFEQNPVKEQKESLIDESLEQEKLVEILERLKDKFGIDYILDTNLTTIGAYKNGKVYINPLLAKEDTPFHEFAHPFLDVIKKQNPKLYLNLAREVRLAQYKGRSIYEFTKANYPDLKGEDLVDESIVQALGIHAKDFDSIQKEKGLMGAIKTFFKRVSQYLKDIIDKNKTIIPFEIDPRMSLRDVASLISIHDPADIKFKRSFKIDLLEESLKKSKDPVYMFLDQAKFILDKQITVLKNNYNKNFLNKGKDITKELDKLVKKMILSKDISDSVNFLNFIELSHDKYKLLASKFIAIEKKIQKGDLTSEERNTAAKDLFFIKEEMKADSYLTQLRTLLKDQLIKDPDGKITKKLSELITSSSIMEKEKIDSLSKDLMADFLYQNDVSSINEQLKEQGKYDQVITKEFIREQLDNPNSDISFGQRWFGALSSTDDAILGLFTKQVDKDVRLSRQSTEQKAYELHAVVEEWKTENNITGDPEEIFDRFIEEALDPTKDDKNRKRLKLVTELDYQKFNEEKQAQEDALNKEIMAKYAVSVQTFADSTLSDTEKRSISKIISKSNYEFRSKNQQIKKAFLEKFNAIDTNKKNKEADEFFENTSNFYKLDNNTEGIDEYYENLSKKYPGDKFVIYNDNIYKISHSQFEPKLSKYKNENFEKLSESDKKLLTVLQDTLRNSQRGLKQKDKLRFWLPSVEKDNIKNKYEETVKSSKSAFQSMKDFFSGNNEKEEDQDILKYGIQTLGGEELKSIKVGYATFMEPGKQTRNIAESIFKYHSVTERYKALNKSYYNALLLQDILDDSKINKKDNNNKNILDKASSAFNRQFIKDSDNTRKERFKDFISMVYYDESDKDKIVAKIGDSLIKFTAWNALGLDAGAAIANIGIANLMMVIESIGGKYYTLKHYAEAQFEVAKDGLMDQLADIGSPIDKSFLMQISNRYEAIQGEFMDTKGNKIGGNKIWNVLKLDKIFMLQNMGEVQAQLTSMVAYLKANKVTSDDGKTEISIFEAFQKDENGMLSVKEGFEKSMGLNSKTDSNTRSKIRSINTKLNGVYDNDLNKAAIQKHTFGRALMLFKRFIYEPGRSRYKGITGVFDKDFDYAVNYDSEEIWEGYYTSTLRNIADTYRNDGFVKGTTNLITDPFITLAKSIYNNGEFLPKAIDDIDYRKRKAYAELSALMLLTLFVAGMEPDDDDEKDEMSWFDWELLYQIKRLQSDLLFNIPVLGAGDQYKNIKSGTAIFGGIDKILKLGVQLANPTEVYKRRSGIHEKGDNKLWVRVERIIPVLNSIQDFSDPEAMIKGQEGAKRL